MCAHDKSPVFLRANSVVLMSALNIHAGRIHVRLCRRARTRTCTHVSCGFLCALSRVCKLCKVDAGHFDLQKHAYLETGPRVD